MSDRKDSAYGIVSDSEDYVGDATLVTLLPMMQRIDNAGTTEDDPDAEWHLIDVTANLSLSGTISLYAVDADGNAERIAGPFNLAALSGVVLPICKNVGRKRDLAYSTTGGGDSAVTFNAYPRRYSGSRNALEFPGREVDVPA